MRHRVSLHDLLPRSQGGLAKGLVVELANNAMAVVVAIDDKGVKLDANNMMAGKKLFFELEVMAITRAPK